MILYHPAVYTKGLGNPSQKELVNKITHVTGLSHNVRTADLPPEKKVDFIKKRLAAKHDTILEHASLSAEFMCDRGVSHEIVRHRLCAFTQSSSRYCDYASDREDGQVRFIIPLWTNIGPGTYNGITSLSGEYHPDDDLFWFTAMVYAEGYYHHLREQGWSPEMARSVLPNSLMTKIIVTANLREWRHIFSLRALGTTGKPHPQMMEVMVPLLYQWADEYPGVL